MKLANSGCGSSGRLFSSGWYCTPMNHGWSGYSTVSGSTPSGDMPENTRPAVLQPVLVVDVDLVAVAVALGNVGRAVDLGDLGVLLQRRLVGAEAHRAAEIAGCDRASAARCPSPTRSSGRPPARSVGPNSVDEAFSTPARLRAASMTAICMPKQMPKYGTLRSRANWAAWILPSEPRSPKPPGTRMPCTFSRYGAGSSFFEDLAISIQSSLTLTRLAMPP